MPDWYYQDRSHSLHPTHCCTSRQHTNLQVALTCGEKCRAVIILHTDRVDLYVTIRSKTNLTVHTHPPCTGNHQHIYLNSVDRNKHQSNGKPRTSLSFLQNIGLQHAMLAFGINTPCSVCRAQQVTQSRHTRSWYQFRHQCVCVMHI